MPRRLISTGSPFEKTAGYSRAVIDGDFAFVAGTTGYDYATMVMPADVTSQSRNCFKTIEAALKEGGFAMADIVRATYYITDAQGRGRSVRGLRRGFRRDPSGRHAIGRRRALQARDEDRDRSDRKTAQLNPACAPPIHSLENIHEPSQIHAKITGPIVMIGFGSIGKGTLPLIERHLDYDKSRFIIIDPMRTGSQGACEKHDVRFIKQGVTKDNYRELLTPLLTEGGGQGFCVNLSVDTSSTDLMEICHETRRSLYRHRHRALARLLFRFVEGPGSALQLRPSRSALAAKKARPAGSTTAVSCCGANPGMVSFSSSRRCSMSPRDLKLNAPQSRRPRPNGRSQMRTGWHQGHPHRRARHPALQVAQRAGRLRQHLVGGRLPVGRRAAVRTRVGYP